MKNILALVGSIARQTAPDAGSISEYRAAIDGRIHALANAHRKLAESAWQGVRLSYLVETELSPFELAGSDRVSIGGSSVVIRPEAAQPIAMAIHELTTNAAKYGALSSEAGTLDISWSAIAGSSGDLDFRWSEDGLEGISAPTINGFRSMASERSSLAPSSSPSSAPRAMSTTNQRASNTGFVCPRIVSTGTNDTVHLFV